MTILTKDIIRPETSQAVLFEQARHTILGNLRAIVIESETVEQAYKMSTSQRVTSDLSLITGLFGITYENVTARLAAFERPLFLGKNIINSNTQTAAYLFALPILLVREIAYSHDISKEEKEYCIIGVKTTETRHGILFRFGIFRISSGEITGESEFIKTIKTIKDALLTFLGRVLEIQRFIRTSWEDVADKTGETIFAYSVPNITDMPNLLFGKEVDNAVRHFLEVLTDEDSTGYKFLWIQRPPEQD
jgi:hypothetical protein